MLFLSAWAGKLTILRFGYNVKKKCKAPRFSVKPRMTQVYLLGVKFEGSTIGIVAVGQEHHRFGDKRSARSHERFGGYS